MSKIKEEPKPRIENKVSYHVSNLTVRVIRPDYGAKLQLIRIK